MKAPELKEKLEESEKLIKELTVTWEEKLRKTEGNFCDQEVCEGNIPYRRSAMNAIRSSPET